MITNEKGLSLIEAVMGMFLLSLVLLGISTSVYTTMSANIQSRSTTSASVLAQDQIEYLKKLGYDSIVSGSDSRTLANITFNRTWTVTTSGNTKTVAVTVSWTDRSSRSVTVASVFAEA
jgi:Tfp pilus assembly protein PilV